MNADQVAAIVEAALATAEPNWAGCFEDDRAAWAERQLAQFREEQVFPEQGLLQVDRFHAERFGIRAGERMVWFITRGDPQSVFYDSELGHFGAAWGPSPNAGQYSDIGFRGDDPLDLFTA